MHTPARPRAVGSLAPSRNNAAARLIIEAGPRSFPAQVRSALSCRVLARLEGHARWRGESMHFGRRMRCTVEQAVCSGIRHTNADSAGCPSERRACGRHRALAIRRSVNSHLRRVPRHGSASIWLTVSSVARRAMLSMASGTALVAGASQWTAPAPLCVRTLCQRRVTRTTRGVARICVQQSRTLKIYREQAAPAEAQGTEHLSRFVSSASASCIAISVVCLWRFWNGAQGKLDQSRLGRVSFGP